MNVPRRNCDHMISQSEKWCITCWEPLIRAAVDETRRAERSDMMLLIDGLSTEQLKEPHEIWLHGFSVCKKAILSILARGDKEPRDAK